MKEHVAETGSLSSKALINGGRSVQIALYQGLQLLFTRLEQWISQGSGNLEPGDLQAPLEGLVEKLVLREVDVSVEAIRKENAQSTVAYIQLCQKAGFKVPERLGESVKNWWENERSEPVRRMLGQAVEKLMSQ